MKNLTDNIIPDGIEDIDMEEAEASLRELLSDSAQDNSDYIMDNTILLRVDNLSSIRFDTDKFKDGIDYMSELAGKITALVNVGITPSSALAYLQEMELNDNLMRSNLEISKINADSNVKSAVGSSVMLQKNMI